MKVGLQIGGDSAEEHFNWKTDVLSFITFKKKNSPLPHPLLNLVPFFVLFINTLL